MRRMMLTGCFFNKTSRSHNFFEKDFFTWIFLLHFIRLTNKTFFSVFNMWVVLDIFITCV